MSDELKIPPEEQDKTVDRAIDAMRRMPIPAGPPPETLRAVLAAGSQAASARSKKERKFKMSRFTRIAAGIVIFAGLASVIVYLTVGQGGTTVAWADVQELIRKAQTVTFKAVMRQEGMPEMEVKVMQMEGGLVRQKLVAAGIPITQIFHAAEGKMLVLSEKEKQAMLINLSGLPEKLRKRHEDKDHLARIKELIEESETELGEKEIDGQSVKGYRVEKDQMIMSIWVDAQTAQPVEIEVEMYGGQVLMTLSDFQFDVELDESLFSLEVPEGYKLFADKAMELKEATTEDLVEFLRFWAETRGGVFPGTVSEVEWIKDCVDRIKEMEKKLSEEELLEWAEPMGRARLFLQTHPNAYRYAGEGVKLGDADSSIFWYKPEDSKTWKVIYGDLRVEDVAEKDLPKTPEDANELPAAE